MRVKHGVWLLLFLAWGVSVSAQQPPADCPAELSQALARAGTQTTLAQQDRDALIRYFQKELATVRAERDALKKQLETVTPKEP